MPAWLIDVWKTSSLRMKALCDANGIRYLYLLQPNQYLPGSKPLSAEEQTKAFSSESPNKIVVEEGYPLLIEAGEQLRAAGVEFHDLSGLFQGSFETLYVDTCCHLNEEGNRLLSLAIRAALRD